MTTRDTDRLREVISCPHAKSDMTPCVARDGRTAVVKGANNGDICVGCEFNVAELFKELVQRYVNAKRKEPGDYR